MIYIPNVTKKINTDLKNINITTVIEKYKEFISSKLSLKQKKIEFILNNTKACNNIIKHISQSYKKPHIIVASTDDSYVISYCKTLEKNGIIDISIANLNEYGIINDITKYLTKKTKLVIIPYVNTDIGTINNINNISTICKDKGVLLYSNIDYLFGRLNKYDLSNINFISIPFTSIGGPKDISLLVHKSDIKFDSTICAIKNIESIMNSLLSISSFKNTTTNFKKIFIKKIDEIFNIIEYKDYIKLYKPSISKISIVLINDINDKINSLNKYILCLSIFSKDKLINNINFKNIEHIFLPTLPNVFDDYIKKGYLIITFDHINDENQINKLLKDIILTIQNQYQYLIEEIKDTVIAKKKANQKQKKIKLTFDPKLTYDITNPKFIQKKHNVKKIKSILKVK